MAGKTPTLSNQQPAIGGLKVQTSTSGLAIPLVWGRTRVAGNALWADDFKAIARTETTSSGGKGGKVDQSTTTYSYQAAVLMGLCAGPINGVISAWRGKERLSGQSVSTRTRTLRHAATVPGGGVVTVPEAAIFYRAAAVRDPAGTTAGRGQGASQAGLLMLGQDYSRSGGTYTFDAAWVGRTVEIEYQVQDGGGATSALAQLGLGLATGVIEQGPWAHLSNNHALQALGYPGIAYVYQHAYPLDSGAQVPNHTFEVSTPSEFSAGIPDADMARVVSEFLTDGLRGVQWPASRLGDLSAYSAQCRAHGYFMSPALTQQAPAAETLKRWLRLTNADVVWSGLQLKVVPLCDESKTANGATYTANTTPVYDLTPADFLADGDEPRLRVSPRANEDAYNHVRVEFHNRANEYNVEVISAKDLAHIELFGERVMDVLQAHEIKTAQLASQVAHLQLQRQLSVWHTYAFRLPWTKGRLEPLDLVTLTDPDLHLDRVPVRITRVREAEAHFEVEAEDAPLGSTSAPLYGAQAGSGFALDFNVSPGNAAAPVIFELPGLFAASGLELAVAVRGATPYWGGCQVWASYDGSSYQQIGELRGASRYGTLTAAVAAGASSAAVNIVSGQLLSGSTADRDALATLCYLGGASPEYVAYETATLTAPGAYSLANLLRGQHGSLDAAHASGDAFVRVDEALARSGPLDPALVGKTVQIKLTSFNIFGGAQQSLADVSATAYTVTGAFLFSPGGGGTGFSLQSTAQAFTFDGTNAAKPTSQTIVFKASTATATWEAKRYDVTGALIDDITASLTGSGATRSLTVAVFGAAHYCVVKATQGADSDQLTIHRLRDGSAGVVGWLTNEAHVVNTDPNGNGGNFGSALGVFEVYDGTTRKTLSGQVTYSFVSSSGIPVGAAIIDANGNYQVTGMATGFDQATAKFRAVYGGVTIEKIFSLSKSKTGAQGAQGADGVGTALHRPLEQWVLNGQSLVTGISDGAVGTTALRLFGISGGYPNQGNYVAIDASRTYRVRFWARPSASTAGLLYFSLRQFVNNAGTPASVNGGRSPYKPVAVSRSAHVGNFGAGWGQYVFDWTSADWQSGAKFVQPEFLDNFDGAAGYWDIQGFEFFDVTEASAAQAAANAANATLGLIASDNTLHRSEKPAVILEWTTLSQEQAGIDARAAAYSITTERSAYSAAMLSLSNYLGGLSPAYNDLASDTPIVGTTFRLQFSSAYSARQTLLNRIAEVAGQRASWGGVTGRPSGFRVVARGLSSTSHPAESGLYNVEGGTHIGPGFMYTVAKINRGTGALSWVGTYNTLSGDAAAMASALNGIGSDHIVIVYSHDEPQGNRLTGGLEAAMYRHGASRAVFGSPRFQYRGAYILVAIGGCGEGNGAEAYGGAVFSDPNAWCDLTFQVLNGSLLVSGANSGARSLADFGYVQTDNLAPGSATLVQVGQIAGPITVSAQSFVPHNSYGQYNNLGGFVFTPSPTESANVEVFVTVTANFELPGGASGNGLMINVGDASAFVAFNRQSVGYAAAGQTINSGFTVTRRFLVPGNVSRTINMYAQVVGSAATLTSIEGRVEVVKR